MNQALTVGEVVWPLLAIGGFILVLGIIGAVLSVLASEFNH